jgi:hypothetical protein
MASPAARARGKRPGRQPVDADKIAAALKLVRAGLSPTVAARRLGLACSTVYRQISGAGIERAHSSPNPQRAAGVRGAFPLRVVYLTTGAMTSDRRRTSDDGTPGILAGGESSGANKKTEQQKFAGRLRAARGRRRWSMLVAGDSRLIGLWLACHFAQKIAFSLPNNKCNCVMTA